MRWMNAFQQQRSESPTLLAVDLCDDRNSEPRRRLRETGTLVGPPDPAPTPALPTQAELGALVYVRIRPQIETMSIGQTQTFELYGVYESGHKVAWETQAVEWRTTGGTVVVDTLGKATAIREGVAIITAFVPTHPAEWRAAVKIRIEPAPR